MYQPFSGNIGNRTDKIVSLMSQIGLWLIICHSKKGSGRAGAKQACQMKGAFFYDHGSVTRYDIERVVDNSETSMELERPVSPLLSRLFLR